MPRCRSEPRFVAEDRPKGNITTTRPLNGSVGTVVLRTLGSLGASIKSATGEPGATLGPGKPLALLVYLSATASRTASRAALCDLLRADVAERQARQTLRQTLWLIREKFGDDVLATTGDDVTLGDRVETDRDSISGGGERRRLG